MTTIYYYSEECYRPELPVVCKITNLLMVENIVNKAAVIETEYPIYSISASKFVALAKGNDLITDITKNLEIGIYLLPFDDRVDSKILNLIKGLQPVHDWGALTLSKENAIKFQIKQTD
jgi:hypothetical protein